MRKLILKSVILFAFNLFVTLVTHAQSGFAVMIIDMHEVDINSFVDEGKLALDKMLEKQNELIIWANDNYIPVIYIESDWGGKTTDSLIVADDYKYITKYTAGAFNEGTSSLEKLKHYLVDRNIDSIILAGIHASACVAASARGALDQGYKVYSSADLTANNYPDGRTDYPISIKDTLLLNNQKYNLDLIVYSDLEFLLSDLN
ncbi:MAG: cysteine hydrolase [Halobacteriovoraceae bacterium]|nr:cysteine hydrolase [Halobacteriovoraceae bacterium]